MERPPHPTPATTQRRFDRTLAAGYALLIAYGTLFPFTGWHVPEAGVGVLWAEAVVGRASRTDMLFNLLIFVPLGLLLVRLTPPAWNGAARVGAAVGAGLLLSLTVETLQLFLPDRHSSLRDSALNGLGAAVGAWAGCAAGAHWLAVERLRDWRARWLPPGPEATLGLWALALWAATELAPLVPWPSRGTLTQGVAPLGMFLAGRWDLDGGRVAAFALAVAAVGTLAATLLRARPWAWTAGLVAAVLALKVPMVGIQATPEAVLGAALGLAAVAGLARLGPEPRLRMAAMLALAAAGAERLRPGTGAARHGFDWTPFGGQMQQLTGLADILGAVWPYLALAYVAVRLRLAPPPWMALGGGLLIAVFALGLEWAQGQVPGRYPDATDPLLALTAWLVPWLHPAVRRAASPVV